MGLARKAVNPVRLFGTDNELIKKLIGFLSAALCVEDHHLIAKLFHEKFYSLRKKLPPCFAFLFLMEKFFPRIFAKIIFLSINIFAGTFVVGNGFKKIIKKVEAYHKKGFLVNLDILGEEVLSEKEAERYKSAYIRFVNEIGPKMLPNTLSVSLKGSAFYSQNNSCAPEYSAAKILKRLTPIMETVAKYGGHAYLDAEDYEFREIHFLVFQELYKKFGSKARFVLQSYLKTYESTLDKLISINNPEDPIWVRIVRGAYWDWECHKSELMGWPDPPVFSRKEKTDSAYLAAIRKGLVSGLNMVPATHNIDSICFAEEYSRALRKSILEIQLLYGMGESIGKLLVLKNIPVRFYMPVQYPKGKLREASGYLIRRVSESQLSFVIRGLGQIRNEDKKFLNRLLRRPG